jgi:hypothetical protein
MAPGKAEDGTRTESPDNASGAHLGA